MAKNIHGIGPINLRIASLRKKVKHEQKVLKLLQTEARLEMKLTLLAENQRVLKEMREP